MDTCAVDGCERAVEIVAKGWCRMHYARWHRHGDPTAWVKKTRARCTVPDCERWAHGDGLCLMHYKRNRTYGTTDLPTRPVVCTVEGCERGVDSNSMCEFHYRRARRDGDPVPQRNCRQCGTALSGDPAMTRRVYCSKDCKDTWNRWKAREDHRWRWLQRYGLTIEQYDALLLLQGGVCAICGRDDPGKKDSWCVDHCHTTGAVRGLLCLSCNVGLGQFGDDPALLLKALSYLESPPNSP